MNELERKLNRLCDASPFRSGYYVKDLETGQELRRNADTLFNSASLRKISVMTAVFEQVNRGKLSLEMKMTVQPECQHNDSGVLQLLSPGLSLSLLDAVKLMIVVSDSTAAGMMADLLTLPVINSHCRKLGMMKTRHIFGSTPPDYSPRSDKNLTTPNDMGLLLDRITAGASGGPEAGALGMTREQCSLALEILSSQQIRNRIPALLPAGVKVANKTGLDFDCAHDAGIVYRDGSPAFVLVVMLDRIPGEMADGMPGTAGAMQLIARMGRCCHDLLCVSQLQHAR